MLQHIAHECILKVYETKLSIMKFNNIMKILQKSFELLKYPERFCRMVSLIIKSSVVVIEVTIELNRRLNVEECSYLKKKEMFPRSIKFKSKS